MYVPPPLCKCGSVQHQHCLCHVARQTLSGPCAAVPHGWRPLAATACARVNVCAQEEVVGKGRQAEELVRPYRTQGAVLRTL